MPGNWIKRKSGDSEYVGQFGASILVGGLPPDNLGCAILDLIINAQRGDRLAIITPLIDDETTVTALIDASQRGVRINIITTLAERRCDNVIFLTRGEYADEDPSIHHGAIRKLARGRVLIRSPDYVPHAKIAFVSKHALIVSSANISANALGHGPSPSIEAGILFKDPAILDRMDRAFKAVWHNSRYAQHISGDLVSVQTIPSRCRMPLRQEEMLSRVSDLEMIWSLPAQLDGIRSRMIQFIEQANETILFVAMSFYDIDRIPGFGKAIMNALKRGVQITTIIRPEQFSPEQYPDPSTLRLVRAGMKLLGINALHAKGLLIDNSIVAIMSANYNPYSLDFNNPTAHVECALSGSTESHRTLAEFKLFLEQLERMCNLQYQFGE